MRCGCTLTPPSSVRGKAGVIVVTICLLLLAPSYSLVPVFFDSTNHWHRDVSYHPEQPARIDACVDAIAKKCDGTATLIDVGENPMTNSESITHQPFSTEELDHAKEMLIRAHSKDLIENLERRCRDSRQRRIDEGSDPLGFVGRIDEDTYVTTQTYDVCLRAAAAWIRAVDHSIGKASSSAFALTRPPGHHATGTTSNGFCLINFAAAATIHVMERHPGLKVSIFDWDVHYGQGVSDIVQSYSDARYVSIHQSPAFPYLGEKKMIEGEYQNILTLPIPVDTTWSCGYQKMFEDEVLPFLYSDDGTWEPDLMLVCAGYDALSSDDLASVNLQANDYAVMTRQLCDCFTKRGRPISIAFGLEGGYQLSPFTGTSGNLADAVVETLQAIPAVA